MENAQIEKPLKKYRNESNYLNHPIIRTTPFPGKINDKLLYSKHSNTHVWNYYSNVRAPTPCGAQTGVGKCLLLLLQVFLNVYVLDYYSRFRISTELLLSLRMPNRGCQTCTSLRQSLQSSNGGCQTCNSLWQSLRSSNRGSQMCNNHWHFLRSSNRG